MKINSKIFTIAFALVSMVLFVSCENNGPEDNTSYIGTYQFNNQTVKIIDGVYSEGKDHTECFFSPQDMQAGKINTYFSITLRNSYMGKEVRAEDIWHNDDYIFIYEDPLYYFSKYKKVKGTIFMEKVGEGIYTVKLDLLLGEDDVPFKANLEHVELSAL